MPKISLAESRKLNGRLMTALKHDTRAQSAWSELCSLPPRAGKNLKKRLFLFSWRDCAEVEGRAFGPAFWEETSQLLGEDVGQENN